MISQPYIFFAEDDDDDFDLMKAAFAECCALKLVRSKNGETALSMLRTWATAFPFTRSLPRIIILDQSLPIFSAEVLLTQIRAIPEYNSTPVLIYCTYPEPRNREFLQKRNAAYIAKPKMMSELYQLVNSLVAAYLPEAERVNK